MSLIFSVPLEQLYYRNRESLTRYETNRRFLKAHQGEETWKSVEPIKTMGLDTPPLSPYGVPCCGVVVKADSVWRALNLLQYYYFEVEL